MSNELDLIVWFNDADQPIGFQFCYDRQRAEHVLTWTEKLGFMHMGVDDGDNPEGFEHKKAPMLVANEQFDIRRIVELFHSANAELSETIKNFIFNRLVTHQDYVGN